MKLPAVTSHANFPADAQPRHAQPRTRVLGHRRKQSRVLRQVPSPERGGVQAHRSARRTASGLAGAGSAEMAGAQKRAGSAEMTAAKKRHKKGRGAAEEMLD